MKKVFLPLILWVTILPASAVEVKQIELFIKSDMTITHQAFARDIDLKVYYVDDVERLEAEVSRQLPKNPQQAKSIAKQLQTNQQLTRALAKAYRAPIQAQLYGIDQLPAAVINRGQGIIYGSTDLAKLKSVAESK